MKRYSVFLLCLFFAVPLCVYSIPAKRGVKKMLTLENGTRVEAELVGDEHGHYWRGTDGKAYSLVSGKDVYQVVDANVLVEYANEKRTQVNRNRIKHLAERRSKKANCITGKKKGLIILVNFSDISFKKNHTRDYFSRVVNEKNFHDGNYKGSVYDYFYDQSIGASERFEVTFDVVGPYTLSQNRKYYGRQVVDNNGKIMSYDENAIKMIQEAVTTAIKEEDNNINFANYDWDGDNYVDMVFVLYAGKGEADSGIEDAVWPHQSNLEYPNYWVEVDGVRIYSYACSSELNGRGDITGIGPICHEFSHCLGFPDFYNTNTVDDIKYKGQGMGYWDLMDGGTYNGDGYQPAGYTSYERWEAGWESPTELTRNTSVKGMRSLQEGGGSYIIRNPNHWDEYYLLENRQKIGWDASLPGSGGLLILHVDYDEQAWRNNKVNVDPIHQRMTWMPADARYDHNGDWDYDLEEMATDTYPYGTNNSFNKNSNPAAWLHHPNINGERFLDSSVENITKNNDGTVSFEYIFTDNLSVTSLDFENWNQVDGVIYDTYMRGTVTVQNISAQTVNQKIIAKLVDADTGIMRSFPINISLTPEMYIEYGFSFSNLLNGHRYFVMICYQSGVEFYRSEIMLCKDEDMGETISGNEDLMAYEYWFDEDFARRETISINSNKAVVMSSIDTNHLGNGVHRLNFRVKRNDGKYSAVNSTTFLKLEKEQQGHLDYWIDDDFENLQSLEIQDSEEEQSLTLDLANCPSGYHKLSMKVATPGSVMGSVQTVGFLKLDQSDASRLEYWFDNDIANKQTLTGKHAYSSDDYIYTDEIDMSELSPGLHRLNFRAVSSVGFTMGSILSCNVLKLSKSKATQLEYWFDDDVENKVLLDGQAVSDGFIIDNQLDLSGLSFGLHRLNFYATSSDGTNKSSLITCTVMKTGSGPVTKLQYWFDGDFSKRRTISSQAGDGLADIIFANDLNISGISPGHHRLYFRGISDNGLTSTAVSSTPVLVKINYGNEGDATMASYSLIIDNDSVVSSGSMSATKEAVLNYTLDTGNLKEGTHTLRSIFWNSYGACITDLTSFVVLPIDFLLGDVNRDGTVNVTDAVCILNYILGNTPSNFFFKAADINKDAIINITDVVGVMNIIMNGNKANSPKQEIDLLEITP